MCVSVCVFVYLYMYVCMRACMRVCVCVCVCVYDVLVDRTLAVHGVGWLGHSSEWHAITTSVFCFIARHITSILPIAF